MREEMKIQNKRITIHGTGKQIEEVKSMLENLELIGVESKDRITIQNALDNLGHKTATILYNGNTVYPKKKLVAEIKKMRRTGSIEKMSDGMYEFLHLHFDIAHYNKDGYISTYDGRYALMLDGIRYGVRGYNSGIASTYTDIVAILEESGLKADCEKIA